jgi:hypothetical protein
LLQENQTGAELLTEVLEHGDGTLSSARGQSSGTPSPPSSVAARALVAAAADEDSSDSDPELPLLPADTLEAKLVVVELDTIGVLSGYCGHVVSGGGDLKRRRQIYENLLAKTLILILVRCVPILPRQDRDPRTP